MKASQESVRVCVSNSVRYNCGCRVVIHVAMKLLGSVGATSDHIGDNSEGHKCE
jgi:hypothetical protein